VRSLGSVVSAVHRGRPENRQIVSRKMAAEWNVFKGSWQAIWTTPRGAVAA